MRPRRVQTVYFDCIDNVVCPRCNSGRRINCVSKNGINTWPPHSPRLYAWRAIRDKNFRR